MRVGVAVVEVDRFGERVARRTELASARSGDAALVGRVGRALDVRSARGLRRRSPSRSPLLAQPGTERVVGLPLLGIELDGLLEGRDGARQVAALAQRLTELVAEEGVRRIALHG